MENKQLTSDEKVKEPLLDQSNSPTAIKSINSDDQNESALFIQQRTVKDKFYLIYIVFLLFGIANLLPWNIFITAEDYFVKYKLNVTEANNTMYKDKFTYIIGNIGQTTNVVMNIFNIFVSLGGNPKNRIPYTLVLSSVVILFHVVLAIIDSSTWPLTFFILCAVSVFVMYIAAGIMNSCIYYVASIFPMEYVNAIILGNNLSGIFCSVMSILSKLTSPNLRLAAIYYFLSAFVVVMLAFIGYFLMHRMEFYRYWSRVSEENKKRSIEDGPKKSVPYLAIIKKIWPLLFSIWFNFFSTLSIFPVFQLGIQRQSDSFIISDQWFQDIVTFLTFNVSVTLGNLLPKLVKFPGPKFLPIPVFARGILAFLFFLLSNHNPLQRTLPVLISNDYVYWAGAAIFPFIFGYFTSLLMMYAPKQVEPEHAGTAAMLSALSLVIGVVSGLQSTIILQWIATI